MENKIKFIVNVLERGSLFFSFNSDEHRQLITRLSGKKLNNNLIFLKDEILTSQFVNERLEISNDDMIFYNLNSNSVNNTFINMYRNIVCDKLIKLINGGITDVTDDLVYGQRLFNVLDKLYVLKSRNTFCAVKQKNDYFYRKYDTIYINEKYTFVTPDLKTYSIYDKNNVYDKYNFDNGIKNELESNIINSLLNDLVYYNDENEEIKMSDSIFFIDSFEFYEVNEDGEISELTKKVFLIDNILLLDNAIKTLENFI